MHIVKGAAIPRDDGKVIEEFIGAVRTRTDTVSVARMQAPVGWAEPSQVAEFDEAVIVLSGILTVITQGETFEVTPGTVAFARRGEPVTFRNDQLVPCEYWSICTPAFRPERLDPPIGNPKE
jgi:probable rRNA maturation factor